MDRQGIDLVAAGPLSADLYDPAAPAWALATAFAARGHSVRVVFPGSGEGPRPPKGVEVAPFSPVTAHVGTFLGDAELARSAARRLRPGAATVVRDPSGLGPLVGPAAGRTVVSFVRSLSVEAPDGAATGSTPPPRRFRLFSWGMERGVRRLEKEALAEATTVCCANGAQRERLKGDYGVPAERLRLAALVVPHPTGTPARGPARRLVGVPDDILLGLVLPPADPAAAAAVAPALEAFRRVRPLFPGVRLGVVGLASAAGPGVVALPSRSVEAVASAVAAADVAIATAPGNGADPGLAVALRAGVPTIVPPTVDLGEEGEATVHRAPTSDVGELASALAGLLADLEEREALAERARAFGRRFEPEHLAESLESSGALGAG